jgi:hypothetical protein
MIKPIMSDTAPAAVRNKPIPDNGRSAIKNAVRRIKPIMKAVIPIIKNGK